MANTMNLIAGIVLLGAGIVVWILLLLTPEVLFINNPFGPFTVGTVFLPIMILAFGSIVAGLLLLIGALKKA